MTDQDELRELLGQLMRYVGMPKVTERNLHTLFLRVRMWENAVEAARWDPKTEEATVFNVAEIRSCIGLKVDAPTFSDRQFNRVLIEALLVRAQDAWVYLAKE